MRATFMPASIRAAIIVTEEDAGPRVAIILAWRPRFALFIVVPPPVLIDAGCRKIFFRHYMFSSVREQILRQEIFMGILGVTPEWRELKNMPALPGKHAGFNLWKTGLQVIEKFSGLERKAR